MKLPLSWLKDYVDIDVSPEVLEEKLFPAVSRWRKSSASVKISIK